MCDGEKHIVSSWLVSEIGPGSDSDSHHLSRLSSHSVARLAIDGVCFRATYFVKEHEFLFGFDEFPELNFESSSRFS
jgi:hypothetical protein